MALFSFIVLSFPPIALSRRAPGRDSAESLRNVWREEMGRKQEMMDQDLACGEAE